MLFSKEKTELNARIETLEAELTQAKASHETLTAELAQAREALTQAQSAHEAKLAELTEQHTQALAAKDDEVSAKVNTAVTDALASAGIPEEKLPKHTSAPETQESLEEIIQRAEAETDPRKKGELANKVLALRQAAKKN